MGILGTHGILTTTTHTAVRLKLDRGAPTQEYTNTCTKTPQSSGASWCVALCVERRVTGIAPALAGGSAVPRTEDQGEKDAARALGEPEQSQQRVLCSSKGSRQSASNQSIYPVVFRRTKRTTGHRYAFRKHRYNRTLSV